MKFFENEFETVQKGRKHFLKHDFAFDLTTARTKGAFLGEQKKTFEPSLALLQMIETDRKVMLNAKASWLFICGRDVFGSGVIEFPEHFAKNTDYLVVNQQQEVLGYGTALSSAHDKPKIVLKNKLDLGNFLRRER